MTHSTPIRRSLRVLAVISLGPCLGGVPGCQNDCFEYQAPTLLDLGVADDIHGIVADPDWNSEDRPNFHAVGAGGLIVAVRDGTRIDRPVATDLHAVVIRGSMALAVGDGGVLVRAPWDGSGSWEVVDAGVTANLYAVVPILSGELVLGDDIVLVHDADADTWIPAPRPPAGWGSLRAGYYETDGTYHVFGLAGVAWSTDDPLSNWHRVDMHTDADLRVALSGDSFVAGSDGTLRRWLGDEWLVWDGNPSIDFVSAANLGTLLAADGRLLATTSVADGALHEVATLEPGMTAVTIAREGEDIDSPRAAIAVGAGGSAYQLDLKVCEVRY